MSKYKFSSEKKEDPPKKSSKWNFSDIKEPEIIQKKEPETKV